jgi:biotin-dependent carboxylase-like uncharacterized protein
VTAYLEVLSPGLHTTVQDSGRWGFQSAGVPVAGPMDPFAHRLANALAGNPRDAATLEVTLVGPTLRLTDRRLVAVAGARFDLSLDDERVPAAMPLVMRAGSILRFGTRRSGARAYVAVNGGFDLPQTLGSRATHVPTRTGGWQGRALASGDRLPLGAATGVAPDSRALPEPPSPQRILRVMPAPHLELFAPDALEALVARPYRVGIDSNRMGYRLEGSRIALCGRADIISEASPLGALQVPASGQPVLLMADHPTTGGYAKIATAISADIGIAGQAAPGDDLHFRLCGHDEAIAALIARERPLLALESRSA